MKKLTSTLLTFLGSVTAFALPVGNPIDATLLTEGLFFDDRGLYTPCFSLCNQISLRIGFYGDYVYNRHMEVDSSSRSADIERTEVYTNAGYLALNLCDRLDLFGTVGASNVFIRTPLSAFATSAQDNDQYQISSSTNFSWSLGGRATVWGYRGFLLGLEGQYFYTRPEIDHVQQESNTVDYLNGLRPPLKYREWQVALGASYEIPIMGCTSFMVPYAAFKYACAHIDMGDVVTTNPSVTLFDLKSKKGWGYAIGVTLVGCRKWGLTLEGRFADEKAFHLNTQFRF